MLMSTLKLDDNNILMQLYTAEYKFQHKTWSIEFWAYNKEEALERVEAMRNTSQYVGQLLSLDAKVSNKGANYE